MLLSGCAATENIANLPSVSESIDFDEISLRELNPDSSVWNLEGKSEYAVYLVEKSEEAQFKTLKKDGCVSTFNGPVKLSYIFYRRFY